VAESLHPTYPMRGAAVLPRFSVEPDDPGPLPFSRDVPEAGHAEKWVEGPMIMHYPNARMLLGPTQIPGVKHEFLQSTASILSMLPKFQRYSSGTVILLDDAELEC
jgi:hypothetical protein